MKKIVTLITIAFLVFNISFAQNTIAKLKFEEAEEAYTNNNFELTLTKIKEVEGLLKSTNPKLLYLKIKAQTKIIEQNPENDYTIIENTRTATEKYLKDYDNLPDNEDKYRDIYKISEQLTIYPKNKAAFDKIALQKRKIELDELEVIGEKKKKSKRITDSILNVSKYKLSITKQEFEKLYPASASLFLGKRNKVEGGQTYGSIFSGLGLCNIYLRSNIVTGYTYMLQDRKNEAEASYKEYEMYFNENLILIAAKSINSIYFRKYKVKEEDNYYMELDRYDDKIFIYYQVVN